MTHRAHSTAMLFLQDLERMFPVLTLHFNYIRKDRQRRRYVVLDDAPEQCLQVLRAGGLHLCWEGLEGSQCHTAALALWSWPSRCSQVHLCLCCPMVCP